MFRPWEDIPKRGNYENEVENDKSSNKDCDDELQTHYKMNSEAIFGAMDDKKLNLDQKYKHADLNDIMKFLKYKMYPSYLKDRNAKSNFRKQCKPFKIENEHLIYKKFNTKVVIENSERLRILKKMHSGSDISIEASALSSHRGRDTTKRLIKKRYFWPRMAEDVRSFIQSCEACQKANPASLKVVPELKSVEVPKQVFEQIGVDIMTLPEIDGYKYVVVAIDYFSKWSEARPLRDKTAVSVARFLYDDIICRHGCPKIQISDQGREFINSLNNELSRLTGTKQRVTSAYHPQANGLVERQNRTIKNCLLKVLQNNVEKWPFILQGVLFAHRTAQHFSTGYSPFKILYQREAKLPIDVDQDDESIPISNNSEINEISSSHILNKDSFMKTLNKMIEMRDIMEDNVIKNIEEAQERQRYSYDKRHNTGSIFKINDKVLVRNLKREDRKGGWKSMPWEGPYTIEWINDRDTCTLKSGNKILKKKQHLSNLKIFKEKMDNVAKENNIQLNKNDDVVTDVVNNSFDNEVLSEDDDVVFISYLKENDERVFNPISKSWQSIKCKQLQLQMTNIFPYKGKRKILGEPTAIKNIIGDGNCLYRALCYWLTGNENDHLIIRKLIAEVIKNNEKIIKYVGGKQEHELYLQKNAIEMNGVWGTDVEIFGVVLLLNTSIYVFSSQTKTWQLFNKHMDLRKPIQKSEKCIYLMNLNNMHFDVVLNV